MTDALDWINSLRRPRLLVEAARIGVPDYSRARVLKKFAAAQMEASPAAALSTLIPVEETLETARRSGDASYVPSRHVEVLIAILAEMRAIVWQPRAI